MSRTSGTSDMKRDTNAEQTCKKRKAQAVSQATEERLDDVCMHGSRSSHEPFPQCMQSARPIPNRPNTHNRKHSESKDSASVDRISLKKERVHQMVDDQLREDEHSRKTLIVDLDCEIKRVKSTLKSLPANRTTIHRRRSLHLKLKSLLNQRMTALSGQKAFYIEETGKQVLDALHELEHKDDSENSHTATEENHPDEHTTALNIGSNAKRRRKKQASLINFTEATKSGEISLYKMEQKFNKNHSLLVNSTDRCSVCSAPVMLDYQSKQLVCTKCSFEQPSNATFVKSLGTQTKSSNGYVRDVYFLDMLHCETGQSCPLTQAQLNSIREYLNSKQMKITTNNVDYACKRMNLNTYAKYRTGITERLSGRPNPMKINAQQERQLLDLFHIVNQSFNFLKHSGRIQSRQNFPYSFILFKLVELCSWSTRKMLCSFRLPDPRPRMIQEGIWRSICEDIQAKKISFIRYINTC